MTLRPDLRKCLVDALRVHALVIALCVSFSMAKASPQSADAKPSMETSSGGSGVPPPGFARRPPP